MGAEAVIPYLARFNARWRVLNRYSHSQSKLGVGYHSVDQSRVTVRAGSVTIVYAAARGLPAEVRRRQGRSPNRTRVFLCSGSGAQLSRELR